MIINKIIKGVNNTKEIKSFLYKLLVLHTFLYIGMYFMVKYTISEHNDIDITPLVIVGYCISIVMTFVLPMRLLYLKNKNIKLYEYKLY